MVASRPVSVIEPPRRWPLPSFRTIWSNRELVYFLIWRNVKARYRQTVIGLGWTLFQPLAFMLVFTLVFRGVVEVPSQGVPYPVFVLAGLLPWIYFSTSVTTTTQSIAINLPLITKVYFPRILLPISTVLTPLIDLLVSLVVLIAMVVIFDIQFRVAMLSIPLLIFAVVIVSFSVSMWFAALNVRYRDIGVVVPFLMQLWLFMTPVVYPGSSVSGALRSVLALNPMVSIIEMFRWALFGTEVSPELALPSGGMVLVLLLTGWIYFLRTEQTFADFI